MTSILETNSTLAKNLEILSKRFPSLAERLASTPLPQIQKTASQDGGYCYVHKTEDGKWNAITDPINPISRAQKAIKDMEDRIGTGFAPAVVLGLDPGYTLEIIFKHFKENYFEKFIQRRIYVIIDSTACLYGWLISEDRSEILNHESVEFYWHQEARRIVRLCKKDETRSHLFMPISSLPESVSMALMDPLAKFFIERQEEEKRLLEENSKYYEKQSDKELNKIIQGKAGRKPRMLIPSHASSTVVQYSVRDTAAMFEKEGWEVRIMNMKTDLSCWRINKNINDFKPDIYLQVNHLRTEDTDFYPEDMMIVTWVQDTVSYINNSEHAKIWNEHVKSKKKRRDLIIGYIGQVKDYGYQEDRLTECPMIVNEELFKAREITAEDRAQYECDICFASNRSKETSLIVKEDLTPKLEKYGFTEDILMSMHDHLWEYYREENTCVGYIQLEDTIIELPEICTLIEKLINKDDHDFVIQRIYWLLNDVIYRHIVLEWISEMKDIKLHLYGRGWEDHPKFSKYAKGILAHGEELSLAYQSAKLCLHLNSLEGEHQRLNEILNAGGTPFTRLSLNEETLEREKQKLAAMNNLNQPNLPFINALWNVCRKVLETSSKDQFQKNVNESFSIQIQDIKNKTALEAVSFRDKENLKTSGSTNEYEKISSIKNSRLFKFLVDFFSLEHKTEAHKIIPDAITCFIFNIFENKLNCNLNIFPVLESNLYCKAMEMVTFSKYREEQKIFFDRIIPEDLIPELVPEYLKCAFLFKSYQNSLDLIESLAEKNHGELSKSKLYLQLITSSPEENRQKLAEDLVGKIQIEDLSSDLILDYIKLIDKVGKLNEKLIKQAYDKNPKLSDLYFKFATKNKVGHNNWYEIIKKDIDAGHLSIKAAGQLSSLQKTPLDKKTIIRDLVSKAHLLTKDCIYTPADFLPIMSQCLNILGQKEYKKLKNKLSERFSLKLVTKAELILELENSCEDSKISDIDKIRLTSRLDAFQSLSELPLMAEACIKRKKYKTAFFISEFLLKTNYPLDQKLAETLLFNSSQLKINEIENYIKSAYDKNPSLEDLFFKFARKLYLSNDEKIEIALKDSEKQKLTINSAAALVCLSVKSKYEREVCSEINSTFSHLKGFEQSNVKSLIPILSQTIKIFGIEKFKTFADSIKSIISRDTVSMAASIAKFENNEAFEINDVDSNQQFKDEISYLRLLSNNSENIEFHDPSYVAQLAVDAFHRKYEKNTLRVLEHLFDKGVLPFRYLLIFISLLRDRSSQKVFEAFNFFENKKWNDHHKLQHQITSLLTGQKITNFEFKNPRNFINALICSETGVPSESINLLPDQSINHTQKLYAMLVYLRAGQIDSAQKLTESFEVKVDFSKPESNEIKDLVTEGLGYSRAHPESMILRDYLIFRLENPIANLKEFDRLRLIPSDN